MTAATPLLTTAGIAIGIACGAHAALSALALSRRAPAASDFDCAVVDDCAVDASARPRFDPRFRRRCVVLVVACIAMWFLGPLLSAGVAIGAWGSVRGRTLADRRRRRQRVMRDVPEALDLIVALLHSGLTLRHTVLESSQRGPHSTRPGFGTVARQLDQGQPFGTAVRALREEFGDSITPCVELLVDAERSGLRTAQMVHQLANESRALRRRRDEAAARSLPVKLSFPLVICTLPSFVLLAIAPAVIAALTSLGTDAW